jgi:hypothetical protein
LSEVINSQTKEDEMKMATKLIRVAGIVLLILGVLFIAAWMMLRSDTIAKPSAAFLTMTQALSPARAVATKCWNEKRSVVVGCNAIKEHLPIQPTGEVLYFATDQGALIGIDYANRVVVVLTPHVEAGELTWHCIGSPPDAVATSCSRLM